MTGAGGEQQELDTEVDGSRSKTRHQQILELYNSENLLEITIGYWSKLLTEAAIISIPLATVIMPVGVVLVYLDIGPVTPNKLIGLWSVFTASLLTMSWCLTEDATQSQSEESDGG